MLLSAENITKNYGIKELLSDVSVFLNAGDKIGIIGVNGTGKSTLLRILAGEEELFDGKLTNYPNVRLSYLSQNPPLNEDFTVLEEVFAGFSPEFRQINEYGQRHGHLAGRQINQVFRRYRNGHPRQIFS